MNKNIILGISILAFGLAIYSQIRLNALSEENQALKTSLEALQKGDEPEESDYELAVAMSRMQVYFNKLWFAGKAENWELAHFYAHEVEETLEEIIEHNVEDDGINVSNLAKIMTAQPFKKLEKSVKKEVLADFETAYTGMMRTCNQCHQASEHSYIQIKIPTMPAFDNQVFAKK